MDMPGLQLLHNTLLDGKSRRDARMQLAVGGRARPFHQEIEHAVIDKNPIMAPIAYKHRFPGPGVAAHILQSGFLIR